jgi:hypothetical protein
MGMDSKAAGVRLLAVVTAGSVALTGCSAAPASPVSSRWLWPRLLTHPRRHPQPTHRRSRQPLSKAVKPGLREAASRPTRWRACPTGHGW